jgi:hypothetical protein
MENGRTVENGNLRGAITYKDIQASNKADAGSEIYAVSEADARSTPYNDPTGVIANFKTIRGEYALTVNSTVDPEQIRKIQDRLTAASNAASAYIKGLKNLPGVVRTETNDKGTYALSLKPGRYYVLVISGNVQHKNSLESKGVVDITTVEIAPAVNAVLNARFDKQEMAWINFITFWQRIGC